MKNNKKRGFTLVELLVVIAILAILATVSVIGYTSFIERANVSNDQNIATQLNKFLEAVKADSTGKYYGVEITPDNAREIMDYVLSEAGLEELNPKAAQHGYHFYYDLKEGKIVVLDNAINDASLAALMFRALTASALDYAHSDNPATCFTVTDGEFTKYEGIRYVFLDTAGSELAELIHLFYNVNTKADFARLQELAGQALLDGKRIPAFNELINRSVFAGISGAYMTDDSAKSVFFGQTMSANKYAGGEPVDAFKNPTSTVTISSLFKFLATNSLKFETPYNGDTESEAVIHFNLTLEALSKRVDPNFTNVVFSLADGKRYVCQDGGIMCLDDGTTSEVESKNPMISFDIEVNAGTGKVQKKGTNEANVAMEGAIQLVLTNIVGEDDNHFDFVSSTYVNWTISSVVVGGTTYTEEDDIDNYVTIAPDGSVTFVAACDEVNFTATALVPNSEGHATQNFKMNVARITSASVKLFDYILTAGGRDNITLVKTPDRASYEITKNGEFTYINGDGITFNDTITWTYSGTGVDGTEGTGSIKLTGKGSGTLTIKIGTYYTFTVNLTIEDTANFSLQPKNMNNFSVLGNQNAVLLSDLFTLNGTVPSGAELVVFAGGSYSGDTYMTPNRTELQESGVGLSVYDARQTLTISNENDLKNYSIQFTGTDASAIRIAVMHNGVRISEDITVKIVDAYNVRTYSDLLNSTIEKTVTNTITYSSKVTKTEENGWEKVPNATKENYPPKQGDLWNTGWYQKDESTWALHIYTGEYKGECGSSDNVWEYVELTYTKTTKASTATNTDKSNIVLLADISMLDTVVITTTITNAYTEYYFELKNGGDIKNPDDYERKTGASHSKTTSDPVTSSVDGYLDIPANVTFYGNGFTFKLTEGRLIEQGIINLTGTLRDTKVVGNVYPKYAFRAGDEYGSSAVKTLSGARIENCYISGCRSPLLLDGDTTLKDTVLYGGIFSNVNITRGNLYIEGEVITINQESNGQVGLGIAFWWSTSGDASKVIIQTDEDGKEIAKLTQYNFIREDQTGSMPTVGIEVLGQQVGAPLGSVFTEMINSNDETYKQHIFVRDGKKYVHTGVSYIDEPVDSTVSIFNHMNKYGSLGYTYAPGSLIGTALEYIIGKDNLPVFVNTLIANYGVVDGAEVKHTENYEFFNSETAKNAATIYAPTYGFGADGKIITNGQ